MYSTLAKCHNVKILIEYWSKNSLSLNCVWPLILGPRKRHQCNTEKYEEGGKLFGEKRRRKQSVTFKFKTRSSLWQNRPVQTWTDLENKSQVYCCRFPTQELPNKLAAFGNEKTKSCAMRRGLTWCLNASTCFWDEGLKSTTSCWKKKEEEEEIPLTLVKTPNCRCRVAPCNSHVVVQQELQIRMKVKGSQKK